MDKIKRVENLYQGAETEGILEALLKEFGKSVNVRIGFSKIKCETKIDNLDFSVRAMNCLKREGLNTIGDVIDAISSEKIMEIRNLGNKTRSEIKAQLIKLSYDASTAVEKKQFLMDVIERNTVA